MFIQTTVSKFVKLKFFSHFIFFTFFFLLNLFSSPLAANEVKEGELVTVTLLQKNNMTETDTVEILAELKIAPSFHTYWKNPGESGSPLEITANLPKNAKIENIEWQTPQIFQEEGILGFGYSDTASFIITIKNGEKAVGEPLQFTFKGVACSSEACIPFETKGELKLEKTLSSETVSERDLLEEKIKKNIPVKNLRTFFESIRAEDKQDHIALLFEGDDLSEKVYFFPEDPDFEVTLLPEKGIKLDNGILVNLPYEGSSKSLKGILVINKKGETHSVLLDIPFNKEGIDFIADNGPKSGSHFEEEISFTPLFLLSTLFFAFIGGMILNLMPCVLPVLSLKVMSFIKMKEKGQKEVYKSAGWFTFGVLISFWVLVALMLLLKSYGKSVGWGFQLQEPWFVAVLGSIFFLFALSLFGFFEIGLSFASKAGEMEAKARGGSKGNENLQSFCSGILATFVATPCTGPFLGSAIGVAFTLPWYISFLIFTFLALGMSFPYLLFAFFPALLKLVPRPGPWMETFKKGMGVILLATSFWLFTVFAAETSWINAFIALISLSLVLTGVYFYNHKGKLGKILKVISVCTLLVGLSGIGFSLKNPYAFVSEEEEIEEGWENFSEEKIQELEKTGTPYFIDFTAKWCLICQANHRTLTDTAVEEKFKEKGIIKIKADWTKNDPTITKELEKYGRNSVPLYIFKEKGKEAILLPQVLTKENILSSLGS